MSPMAGKILELVTARRTVSFAEMEDMIPGFGGGDQQISFNGKRSSNVVLWFGLTMEACDALEELREQHKIHPIATSALTYLIDGKHVKMPVARALRHYKKPHWLPVVFNPGRDPLAVK